MGCQGARRQVAAEKTLIDLAEIEALQDVMPVGVVLARNDQAQTISFNAIAADILGCGSAKRLSDLKKLNYSVYQGRECIAFDTLPLSRALNRGESTRNFEARVERRDGQTFDVRASASPLFAQDGRICAAVLALSDLTAAKTAQRHERVLQAALQHRVRNMLASVRSLMSQTLQGSKSLEEFGDSFEGRLRALATTENIMSRTGIGHVDIHELVVEVLPADIREDEHVVIAGPRLLLTPRAAQMLALAFHELATNSLRHGAWSSHSGRVRISWEIIGEDDGGNLKLLWSEVRDNMADFSEQHGLDLDLVENGLPYELGGTSEISIRDGMLACTIELPAGQYVAAVLADRGDDPTQPQDES